MVYLVISRREGWRMALTIGQVADAADVNIQTIRYYERRGLFPNPRRTPAGYRQYADDAVPRLRFIKHAQELGFSLQEIQELLGLRVRHGAACDAVERKTRQKIEVVQQRIRDLQRMKRTLERLAAACTPRRPTDACPILEVLEDHDDIGHKAGTRRHWRCCRRNGFNALLRWAARRRRARLERRRAGRDVRAATALFRRWYRAGARLRLCRVAR